MSEPTDPDERSPMTDPFVWVPDPNEDNPDIGAWIPRRGTEPLNDSDERICAECGHPVTAHQAAVTRQPGRCAVCGCRATLADRVRSYICDTADGPLGHGDHGHTDCWHLSIAADIIEARDAYTSRTENA